MVAYDIQSKFKVTTNPDRAREILEKRIEAGRASAANVFERINTDVPVDTIARGSSFRFAPADKGGGLVLGMGTRQTIAIHRHALSQLGERGGLHGAQLTSWMGSGEPWQVELAAEALQRHYAKGEAAGSRYLVRAVKDEARGVLSDKYRRLDSRPLAEDFATECQKLGAVPVEGTITDTRVAIKALLPMLLEPVPGEVMALGVEWHNSDYGAGMHSLRAFLLRVWCLNGATMENALAQVHIGGRLSDEIEMSEKTYRLDTEASRSALRDIIRGVLAPKRVEALCAGIQRADANKVEWRKVSGAVGKRLLKGELEAARAAFEGDDVYNLPAGKSVWRASNALSWIAGQAQDPERKLEIQRLAGEVLESKTMAAAA